LYFALRYQVDSLRELGSGATFAEVSKTQLQRFTIAIPPVEEQRRIAAALKEQLAAAGRAKAAAEARRASTGALAKRYVRDIFDSPIASQWPRLRLASLCSRITDGTHQPPPFTSHGVPFLFVRNIVGGRLDFTATKFVSAETYEALVSRCRPGRGDVLYSAVGSFGVAVVVDTDRPFTFQRHIAHLKPNKELVIPEFLATFLNSPAGRAQSDASALGGAQRTVTLGALARFEVPCPALAVQAQMVARTRELLGRAERLKLSSEAELGAIRALPGALQRRAFSGAI
jgi:restriction endonuclease S subunit